MDRQGLHELPVAYNDTQIFVWAYGTAARYLVAISSPLNDLQSANFTSRCNLVKHPHPILNQYELVLGPGCPAAKHTKPYRSTTVAAAAAAAAAAADWC